MTINLFDIPAATAAYIDQQVTVTITDVTRGLTPDHVGAFTVTVQNAAEPEGVRLTDVVLHLSSTDGSVLTLKPPGSALLQPRGTNDINSPRLGSGDEVEQMFVFFSSPGGDIEPNATLDVGEATELEFEYHSEGAGTATILCHPHASVDVDALFPRSRGTDGDANVTVKP